MKPFHSSHLLSFHSIARDLREPSGASVCAPLSTDLIERIPQEIFDKIIASGERSEPGNTQLKAFSLVSHAWEESTRPVMFSYRLMTRDFVRFMSKDADEHICTRILPYIRRASFRPDSVFSRISRSPTPTDVEEGLRTIVPRMKSLSALEFNLMEPELVGLLGSLCGSGATSASIQTLDIEYISFSSFKQFQDAIALFPGVQNLTLLRGWESASVEDVQSCAHITPLRNLKTVEILPSESTSPDLLWLSRAGRSIQSLEVQITPSDVGAMSCFTRLEHLYLGFARVPRPEAIHGLLSGCRSLKTLQVTTPVDLIFHPFRRPSQPDGQGVQPVSWCSELLSSITSPLTELTIKLQFDSETDLDIMDWQGLNTLLQSPTSGASLKVLRICVQGYIWRSTKAACKPMFCRRVKGLQPGCRFIVNFWLDGLDYVFESD
ncbi:hypothetical protein D9611_002129 [Ephemerocybe angulata]|uniref:F-box domain-containing protein n=1 Tax=Ephemerocybe angulata TaxID=980116 RepID=A0A8H5CI40_9AGAR|nr:hypothetical protein D9611_002129 [Tulosesus angulatus]